MPLSSVDIPHSTPWKTVFGLAQLTDDPHTWMLTGGLIRPVVIADMYHRRLFIFMHPMYTCAMRPSNHTTTRYRPTISGIPPRNRLNDGAGTGGKKFDTQQAWSAAYLRFGKNAEPTDKPARQVTRRMPWPSAAFPIRLYCSPIRLTIR